MHVKFVADIHIYLIQASKIVYSDELNVSKDSHYAGFRLKFNF